MRYLAVVLLLCSPGFASKKPQLQDSDWSTGTLLEQASERECKTHGAGNVIRTDCQTITQYRIDAANLIYIFSNTTRGRLLNVTTNAPLKYVVRDRDAFIVDDEGKQHKLRIVEKIKKPQPELK